MATSYLTAEDVLPLLPLEGQGLRPARVQLVLDDVHADATRVAPCLADPITDPVVVAQVRSILRAAAVRRLAASASGGATVSTAQTIGPWQQVQQVAPPTVKPRGLFWPSEIAALQGICADVTGSATARAWHLDTLPQGAPQLDAEQAFARDMDDLCQPW